MKKKLEELKNNLITVRMKYNANMQESKKENENNLAMYWEGCLDTVNVMLNELDYIIK